MSLARILGRLKILLPTSDLGLSSHLLLDGFWEIWLTLFLLRWLGPGMVVVDAGANVGYFSLLAAQAVGPTGSVIAVEPNPAVAALLRRSLALNGFSSRARVIEAALGEKPDGRVNLFVPDDDSKNARAVGNDLHGASGFIEVQATNLDEIGLNLERVDLIKIDVEGAEGDVIAGMMEVLVRFRPAVILEFNALRLKDPAGALDRLLSIYGSARELRHDSTLRPITRDAILAHPSKEDIILFFGEDRGLEYGCSVLSNCCRDSPESESAWQVRPARSHRGHSADGLLNNRTDGAILNRERGIDPAFLSANTKEPPVRGSASRTTSSAARGAIARVASGSRRIRAASETLSCACAAPSARSNSAGPPRVDSRPDWTGFKAAGRGALKRKDPPGRSLTGLHFQSQTMWAG